MTFIGMAGFEPTTPRSQSECSNQAELHSGNIKEINGLCDNYSYTDTVYLQKCLAIYPIETIGLTTVFLVFFLCTGFRGRKTCIRPQNFALVPTYLFCRREVGFMPIIRLERMTY